MKEILDFLTTNRVFFFATTDENNQPRVRPFGLVFEWENKLTFGTNTTKKVYQQLEKNPYVEICSFSPATGEWMRISGKVKLFQNRDANRKIFEVMPELKKMYQSEENPIMTCCSFISGEAALYSFASNSSDPVNVIKL